jgi:hypothetical protein
MMMPAVHLCYLFEKMLVQKGFVHSFAAKFLSRDRSVRYVMISIFLYFFYIKIERRSYKNIINKSKIKEKMFFKLFKKNGNAWTMPF